MLRNGHITYDHREWRTGLPVRSAVLKPLAGWLVVGWVTTSESQLLYVFFDELALSSEGNYLFFFAKSRVGRERRKGMTLVARILKIRRR